MVHEVQLPDDFYKWLAAHCDGTLTDDESRQLSRLLVDSSAARRVYAGYMYQHAVLFDEYAQTTQLVQVGGLCQLPPAPARRAPIAAIAIAVVAGIAAAIALLVKPVATLPPSGQPMVAQVSLLNSYQVRWGDEGLREGVALPVGRPIELLDGAVHLVTADGTELLLEGPAELQFRSSMVAELRRGRVSVRVPEVAVGFTIRTADTEVIDLGTEFAVGSGPLGSEVHVFDGRVRVVPVGTAAARDLVAGNAVVVRPGGNKVEAISIQPDAFRSQAADLPLTIASTGADGAERDVNWMAQDLGTGVWRAAWINNKPTAGLPEAPTLANTSASRWIQPSPGGTQEDHRKYAYKTSVHLPAHQPAAITLYVRHLADDLLEEIRFNGTSVWRVSDEERQKPYANTDRFRELTLRLVAEPGENELEFWVFNGDAAYPDRTRSLTMFRAEIDGVWHRQPLGFTVK